MSDALQIDLDFRANNDDALAALSEVAAGAGQLETALTSAFDTANQIATALASASQAGDQLFLFDGVESSATAVISLFDASASAAANVEDSFSRVAGFVDDAALAAQGLTSGAEEAAAAADGTAAATEKVQTSTKGTGDEQAKNNEKAKESQSLAERLSAEFEKIQGKVGGIAGPMSRFTDEALKAVGALEGISGLAVGGLAAGAAGLLAAGSAYKSASDTITLATGATGTALHGLQDDFNVALQGSGRSAGDLAQILAGLNRDTGATGATLSDLTDETAKFLKVTNGGVGDVRGLTQAMLALGVGADGLTGFEDQLATVTTHFGISLSSLVQQIKVAGPALATFGFDPGQVAGLIGELDQAGLSITRLVPGFTKLANTASGEGKTAAQALNELIENIKGAGDAQAALNEVQGVFSGRVAAQFVNAVRNGTVDIGKLNAVMATAPGTVDRLGASVKGLAGQFGGIRNDILAAFGQQGLPLLEGLRQGIEDIRPFLRDLFKVLGDLSPLFKGFAEAAFLPVEALRLLGPPLQVIDAVLSHIPAPVLEAVGALAAFKLLPFGLITQGLTSILSGLQGFLTFGGGFSGAASGISAGIAAINPVALAATAAVAGLFFVMQRRSSDAAETKRRLDAVTGAVKELSATTDTAVPKIEALLSQGSKGGVISSGQLADIAKLGATLDQVSAAAQAFATGDTVKIHDLTQQLVDLEKAGLAAGHAFDGSGIGIGHINEAAAGTKSAIQDVVKGINEQALAQLNQLTVSGKITAQDRVAAAVKLGLKDETEGEARVRDFLVSKLNLEAAAKAGLATGDAAADQRTGQTLTALEAEGALRDQVAGAASGQAKLLNELAAASKNGVASDKDRVRIAQELVAGGLSEEDAAKRVAKAEQDLANVQAAHTPITKNFADALHNVFEQIGHGTPEWQALSGAAQAFNVDVTQLGPAFDQLNSKLLAFAPPIKVGDDVMGQLLIDMQRGLPIQSTFKDLLEVSGGNAEVAFAALDQYKQGVENTTKALDGLNPSLGTTLSKLEDAAAAESDPVGLNAEGAGLAIAEAAKARKDALEAEKKDLENQKTARSEAASASEAATKKAIENQRDLAKDAAKARGEAFDSTAFDLQIQAIKVHTDTDDLDAQIKDIEGRQKGVDEQLARAGAALAVFNDEERAIHARSSLQDSDLAHQQDILAASRLVAEQQAAAAGIAFDPTSINNRINDLQVQRDKLAAGTNQAVADAQSASARVQGAVEDAQGGLLDFGAVLDTFDAKLRTEALQAQTVSELKGQGFDSIVKVLFDPEAGLNAADQAAFLDAIATASPEERAAIDAHAKESLKLIADKDSAVKAAGDIFASPNATAVDNAKKRGDELAKGLADGFVQTLDDSKINEIIDLVIKTGVDPTAARKAVLDKVAAAKAAAAPGQTGLAGVGISADQVAGAEQALGLAGTTSGALYVQGVKEAISQGIPLDAAAAMLAPVQDQLPIEGQAGGQSVAQGVQEAIEGNPINPDAAGLLAADLRAGLSAEGTNGGINYATAVPGGMALYPVPTEAGTILVSSVSQALSVAGTDAGANYALSIAAGIAAKQGDLIEAAHLAAITVDAAGHAGLEAASPSKKGIRLGGFWIDGLIQGMNDKLPKLDEAALATTETFLSAFNGTRINLGGAAFDALEQSDPGLTSFRDKLLAAGWAGRPDDMAEALYPPAGFTAAQARLSIAGTELGANYAQAVASGITDSQQLAAAAAAAAAAGVDAAGQAGLDAHSPSRKGLRLGGSWIDGIVAGITDNIDKVKAAAFAVGDAVTAPLPSPVLVGAGARAGGNETATFGAGAGGTATAVHIENVNVTGTTNGTPEEMAAALSRKIGWLGITGRAEL